MRAAALAGLAGALFVCSAHAQYIRGGDVAKALAPPDTVAPDGRFANNLPRTPSERNPLLALTGQVRTRKLLTQAVYDEAGRKIAHIDDIVLNRQGAPVLAVLDVGGFIIAAKLVAVPWSRLRFGDANLGEDQTIILTGLREGDLRKLPDFSYNHFSTEQIAALHPAPERQEALPPSNALSRAATSKGR